MRSSLGNIEGVVPESSDDYSDPGEYLRERFYVGGLWRVERERMLFQGSDNAPGLAVLRYEALEANAVLSSSSGKLIEVELAHDGRPLTKEYAGSDVIVTNESQSILFVDKPRMYQLTKNKEFGEHLLRLRTSSAGLELYAFSFTSCVLGGVVP